MSANFYGPRRICWTFVRIRSSAGILMDTGIGFARRPKPILVARLGAGLANDLSAYREVFKQRVAISQVRGAC